MRTPKLYDSTRHPEIAANIAVVENIALVVHSIRRGEVVFLAQPNIEGFHQSKTEQNLAFTTTDETRFLTLSHSSPPVQVSGVGTRYAVALAEIGAESLAGVPGKLDYCIFDVSKI